jgi:hypothetical protein
METWWLLLPSVGVFVLSVAIFSLTAFGLDRLVAVGREALAGGKAPVHVFAEVHARLSWAGTVLVFYCAFLAAAIYSARVVMKHRSASRNAMPLWAGLITGLLMLGYLAYSGRSHNNFSYIFYFTIDLLTASQRYDPAQLSVIHAVLFVLNILAGVVPVLGLITAGCCAMTSAQTARTPDIEVIKEQMRELKTIAGFGSALLVAGILHMVTWLRWPAALFHQTPLAQDIAAFAEAMGLYWGATFSLVLAAFYVPAAAHLHRRAEACFRARPELARETDLQTWLREHGLAMVSPQQLPPLLAVLAPLLAEPVGSLLSKVSGSPIVGG